MGQHQGETGTVAVGFVDRVRHHLQPLIGDHHATVDLLGKGLQGGMKIGNGRHGGSVRRSGGGSGSSRENSQQST